MRHQGRCDGDRAPQECGDIAVNVLRAGISEHVAEKEIEQPQGQVLADGQPIGRYGEPFGDDDEEQKDRRQQVPQGDAQDRGGARQAHFQDYEGGAPDETHAGEDQADSAG